jgi:hypothetical protein
MFPSFCPRSKWIQGRDGKELMRRILLGGANGNLYTGLFHLSAFQSLWLWCGEKGNEVNEEKIKKTILGSGDRQFCSSACLVLDDGCFWIW